MSLEVCEIFRSLAGETRFAGHPATFVRLSGCNLRCAYCDTRYALEPGRRVAVREIVDEIDGRPAGDLVVITGGEPLRQEAVHELLGGLASLGRQVLLETNGSLAIDGVDERVIRIMDIKCPGSGEAAANRFENLAALRPKDEVKFVLSGEDDFEWALARVREHGLVERCRVVFSPAFDRLSARELAAWLLASGEPIRLGLQLHRLLWPERSRGV